MLGIIYAIVIFIATCAGACAGLGGGVIIKPVLDLIGAHDLNMISFLSTSAVFTMAVYSTIKQIFNKVKFDVVMILLIAIGSAIGGNIGGTLFSTFDYFMNAGILKAIQSALLTVLLIIVLVNVNGNFKTYQVKNKAVTLLIGFLLGSVSSFLGIGGGPINVAVFTFFFSVNMKTAAVYSVTTILFSQASKLLTIATSTGFGIFDLSLLIYTLPAALLGGVVGTALNKKADDKFIAQVFNVAVVLIIFISIYNIYNGVQSFL